MLKSQMKKLSLTLMVFLLLTNCRPLWEFAPLDDNVIDGYFPDLEIVFQLDQYPSGGADKVGFVSADGNEKDYIYREDFPVTTPVWTDDGKAIIFVSPLQVINALIEKDCHLKLKNLWAYQPSIIHGTREMLLNSAIDEKPVILRVDLFSGDVLETYQMNDSVYDIEIGTNNLVNQQLLYQRSSKGEDEIRYTELVVSDIETGKEKIILEYDEKTKRIIRPAFSPDGQWIAYTSNDGIYLIRPDGSDNHQLIELENGYIVEWSPAVAWSPEGKSFVFHHCTLIGWQDCDNNVQDTNIIKYDLETGEETVLVEGGINPYWRWREESP